jgi:ABC-type multidrug transport system fused ATPase/permease subunit
MTLGSLTAIMVYISQLIGLQGNFAFFFQRSMLGLVSCERLKKILDEESKIIEAKGTNHRQIRRSDVEFRGVSFGYIKDKLILQNLSFNIKSRAYVALVGHSGCGKTTILNLILRLYDPWAGDIFIGGYNVKEIRLSLLKEQIGVTLQEPLLWNDTIESNIRYGRPDASEQEIIEFAKIYGVHDFVSKFPNRYKTIAGERACKISEGQKQKIAILRALIKKPKILILDEAFSSMDSESEEMIMRNIRTNFKDTTFLVVSHRLSTVMGTDLVYFLNREGRLIIDFPQNLLQKNKEFSDLFSQQNKEGGLC